MCACDANPFIKFGQCKKAQLIILKDFGAPANIFFLTKGLLMKNEYQSEAMNFTLCIREDEGMNTQIWCLITRVLKEQSEHVSNFIVIQMCLFTLFKIYVRISLTSIQRIWSLWNNNLWNVQTVNINECVCNIRWTGLRGFSTRYLVPPEIFWTTISCESSKLILKHILITFLSLYEVYEWDSLTISVFR